MANKDVRHLKEVTELRFANLKEARELQAKEYERRLSALNHAHEAAVQVQHTYVTQDKYEDFIKAYNMRQREIDKTLDGQTAVAIRAQEVAEAASRRMNINLAIVGLVIAIVVAVANWLST